MSTLNFRDVPQTPLTRALGLIIDDYGNDGDAEAGCTWLTGHIDAGPEHHQPMGIVHGGVYCSMVESLASVAAYTWIAANGGGSVVGVNNNTDFLRAISGGTVYGTAVPIHRGRRQQLWQVSVVDSGDRLVARGQVRLQNLETEAG